MRSTARRLRDGFVFVADQLSTLLGTFFVSVLDPGISRRAPPVQRPRVADWKGHKELARADVRFLGVFRAGVTDLD
ncbi:hypothetical protein AArcSl_2463 [Halalkaliarchaeum desulfuricum]|uniref:Uncharacterized protein n=1 Tax=Halalkaliarchaeum desulfuricum TaxID=2055893 RepID=A0A343TLW2_9EURY|nr:hypothetical protein AArcSl_2463 [Halalkaliarchaeum desulfuricum]